jgi:response regulator of citrate/malate metabolism
LNQGNTAKRLANDLGVSRATIERDGAYAELGGRNLSPDQLAEIRGRIYNRAKRKRGGTGANQHTEQRCHSDTAAPERTRERLAEDLGVSPRTLARDGEYADAVEELAEDVAPELPPTRPR